MALIGETLAHTAFAGVAFGLLFAGLFGFGGSPLLAALIVSTVGALGVNWLTKHTDSYGDVPIAVVLSGSFAVATLVITYGRGQTGIDIEGYLFGDIAIVTAGSARLMAVLTVCVVGVVVWFYKELVFTTFDEQAARVARLDVDRYNTLLVVVTAVVVVGSMQILGVILVAGMLVIPVAAASQVSRSFRETVYVSIIFGQASVVAGFAFAVVAGMPSGGSIIVMTVILYVASVLSPD
jgi:zinc transport system permease protein